MRAGELAFYLAAAPSILWVLHMVLHILVFFFLFFVFTSLVMEKKIKQNKKNWKGTKKKKIQNIVLHLADGQFSVCWLCSPICWCEEVRLWGAGLMPRILSATFNTENHFATTKVTSLKLWAVHIWTSLSRGHGQALLWWTFSFPPEARGWFEPVSDGTLRPRQRPRSNEKGLSTMVWGRHLFVITLARCVLATSTYTS